MSNKNKNKIEALIFDMDGLLIDSERMVKLSWNYAGEVLGYGAVGEHIVHTLGMNKKAREAYFRTYIKADFDMAQFDRLNNEFFYELEKKDGIPIKKGARELLDYAKEQGIPMALATSSSSGYAKNTLNKLGIFDYFDVKIFGDMVTRSKPDPEIYQKSCALLGVNPGRCYGLEDAPNGVLAVHAAGMMPILVPDLVQPSAEIEKLVYRKCESLSDVILVLEETKIEE